MLQGLTSAAARFVVIGGVAARQFKVQPGMTLTTREGELDVLAHVDGLGGYAKVKARAAQTGTTSILGSLIAILG